MEQTMGLKEITKILRKRLLLIIILIITSTGISAAINFYMLTPIYTAQSQILVNDNAVDSENYSKTQLDKDIQLINTYYDIIISPAILSKVIGELELDKGPNQLANKITLYSESNSKVLKIDVVDSSYEQAVNIANTVAEIFKEEVPSLMKVNNINILATAEMSENPYPISPNKKLNLTIGLVFGLILGVGLAFLLEYLDTTIKDEKDIVEVLNIPIMGIVGSIPLVKEKKYSYKSHRVRSNQSVWTEK